MQGDPAGPALKFTLLASSALTIMAGATIAPSLPAMSAVFADAPGAAVLVPLIMTITALGIVAVGFPAGMLVDRFGGRRVLVASLVLYALSGTAGLWMSSLVPLLVSRFVLGCAVAGVMTCATTLVSELFEGPRRQSFLGMQAAFTGFGGVAFLVLGGYLANVHWRLPFLVYLAPFAILPFAWNALKVARRSSGAHRRPSGPARVPWKTVAVVYLLAFLSMVVFYVIPVHIPYYVRQIADATPGEAGITMAVSTLTQSVVALNYRRIAGRLPHLVVSGCTFVLLGAGFVALGFAEGLAEARFYLVLTGAGMGFLMPNMVLWLSNAVPEEFRGRANGMLGMAFFLGQFMSPLAAQPMVHSFGYAGIDGLFAGMGLASIFVGILLFAASSRPLAGKPGR